MWLCTKNAHSLDGIPQAYLRSERPNLPPVCALLALSHSRSRSSRARSHSRSRSSRARSLSPSLPRDARPGVGRGLRAARLGRAPRRPHARDRSHVLPRDDAPPARPAPPAHDLHRRARGDPPRRVLDPDDQGEPCFLFAFSRPPPGRGARRRRGVSRVLSRFVMAARHLRHTRQHAAHTVGVFARDSAAVDIVVGSSSASPRSPISERSAGGALMTTPSPAISSRRGARARPNPARRAARREEERRKVIDGLPRTRHSRLRADNPPRPQHAMSSTPPPPSSLSRRITGCGWMVGRGHGRATR